MCNGKLDMGSGTLMRNIPKRIYVHKPRVPVSSFWFEDEIELVKSLSGTTSGAEILKELNALRKSFGLRQRSIMSLFGWAERVGISLKRNDDCYSLDQVMNLFGVTQHTVMYWVQGGYLQSRRWGAFVVLDHDEIIRFIKTDNWLFDIKRMQDGHIKMMAEMYARRNPWMKPHEIAVHVPSCMDTVRKYIKRGSVMAKKRPGYNGTYMIQASMIPVIRELIHEAHESRYPNLRKNEKKAA